MRPMTSSEVALANARKAVAVPVAPSAPPPEITAWLARLRLLHGAPFPYLVVDDDLLPEESIRFFYVDRNWTDAAVEGALSVGASTKERTQLSVRYADVRQAVDVAERNVLQSRIDPGATLEGSAGEVVTGLLLRSRAVSGWPGLRVRATRDGGEVRMLRLERLAPAVLLALFDGVPERVLVEEPRQGVQFGFDASAEGAFEVPSQAGSTPVPFRSGSPGVVEVAHLAARLGVSGSASLARSLMQFPFSQQFAGTPVAPVFETSISMEELADAFGDAT